MPLTEKDIRALLQNPKSKSDLVLAAKHESRLRFHSQTRLEDDTQDRDAENRFLFWVRSLIPADKYAIFTSLFRYPVKTVNLTSEAYAALEKVFDGRNPAYVYNFTDSDLKRDWEEYRTHTLCEPHVWRETGFEVMKTAINSVMVVDLPRDQEGDRPAPYFYFLPVTDVVDFCQEKDKMQYLIFRQPDNRLAVLDEATYRVYVCEGAEIKSLEVEVPHDLGYCPARFFWNSAVSLQRPSVKRSPITNHLGDLDWYLFFSVSKRHLDLYAPYPIYSGFSQDCDYSFEGEGGTREECDGGYLRAANGQFIHRAGVIAECPVCSKKRIAGVGSFVEVPPPSRENDNADLRNPVQITTIDSASLEYNTTEIARLEKVFYESVTGYGSGAINTQAVNEDQVRAFLEGRTTMLRNLKKEFESAQKWVDETVCRLRYGDAFTSASVDYGSEFYLLTSDELLALYLKAVKEGADTLTLDSLQKQYYETRFHNNPTQLQRTLLLLEVEPLRHLTREQVKGLYYTKAIGYEEYMLKVNFSSLVMRFELENTVVTGWGLDMTAQGRVEKIRQTLISYIKKPETQAQAAPMPSPAPVGGPAGQQ